MLSQTFKLTRFSSKKEKTNYTNNLGRKFRTVNACLQMKAFKMLPAGRKFPVRRNFNNVLKNGKLVQRKNHGPESSNGPDCPCPPPWVSLPSTPCQPPGATIPCSRDVVAELVSSLPQPYLAWPWALLS